MALEFQIVVDDKGSAKVKKFSKNVGKSGKASEKASKALKVFGGSMAVVGAGAVTAGKQMFDLVNATTKQVKEISQFAKVANVSETEFQKLAFGAKSVGIESDKLADIYKDVNDRIGDFAKTGGGPMADFFEQIGPLVGVTIDDFRELSGPKALQLFTSSLEKAGASQQEMTFYLESMASDTTALLPLLKEGGKGFQELGERAEGAGVIIGEDMIQASQEFQSELGLLGAEANSIFMDLSEELIPVFLDLFEDISKSIEIARPAIENFFENFGELISDVAGEIGDLILGWSQIAKEVTEFFGEEKKLDFKLSPEAQARIERVEKAKKLEEDQRKKEEKEAKKAEREAQARILKRQKAREKAQKKAEADAKKEEDRRRKQAEKDQSDYENFLKKQAEDQAKAEEEKRKEAEETAQRIKELNSEIDLALMEEYSRQRETARLAHDERIKQGADEFSSRKLMEQELTAISAQQEDERLAKRQQTMSQIQEGFSQTSTILNNISELEQQAINNKFDERARRIEDQFAKEIEGAEGNSEEQERIKAERDEKLRQLDNQQQKEISLANKRTAGLRKGVAIGEALINGALAVTRAYAEGGPFAGPFLAGMAGAVTATQVALISQQKFFEGGMMKGKDVSFIRANENGTESILNARATSAVGEDALNDFNSGRTQDALDKIQSSLSGGSKKSIQLNIKGGIIDKRFMNETLIPSLNREMRRK